MNSKSDRSVPCRYMPMQRMHLRMDSRSSASVTGHDALELGSKIRQ